MHPHIAQDDSSGRAMKGGRTLVVLAVASAWALAGCASLLSPLPANAEAFDPPATYSRWWSMVEQCSARRGNLAAVHWYRAPVVTHNGERVGGVFNVYMNRIVLAEEYREAGPVVRH